MGQMSTSVPPQVLQSLQMYGQNKTASAEMAQRGAMHRDQLELDAAQFEAKVRMEQQQMEFQKQQAMEQADQFKAQLGEREKDRVLEEKMAERSEKFTLRMKQSDIQMAMAKLNAMGAMDASIQKGEDAATEQEQAQKEAQDAALMLQQIAAGRGGASQEALKLMTETDTAKAESLKSLGEQFGLDAQDIETQMFAQGENQLDRSRAWDLESAEVTSGMVKPSNQGDVSTGVQKGVNAVLGGTRVFDPEVPDPQKVEEVVGKKVDAGMQALSQRAAKSIADPGQEGAAAGALHQVAMFAATLSAAAASPTMGANIGPERLAGYQQRLVEAIAAAEKAGVDRDELYTFINAAQTSYSKIFEGPVNVAKGEVAGGKTPQKAVMALNQRAKEWVSGMTLAIEAAGVANPDKAFKERVRVYEKVARVLTEEQDETAVMSELLALPGETGTQSRGRLLDIRTRGKFDQEGSLKAKQEQATQRELGARKKGRAAQREGEAAGARALSGGLSDVMKGLGQ